MKRILVSTTCSLVLAVGGYFLSGVLTTPAHGDDIGTPPTGQIFICHATGSSSNPYIQLTADASGNVSGHAGHPDDIIPVFTYTTNTGETATFPGQNLGPMSQFGGVTGQQILDNGCNVPPPTPTTAVTTAAITTGQTVTVVVPGETPPANVVTQVVTQTVTLPGQTVTSPGQTVTLPGQVVTQVQTVQGPPQTITVQGPTHTVTVTKTKTRTILKAAAHKTKRAKKKPHFTG